MLDRAVLAPQAHLVIVERLMILYAANLTINTHIGLAPRG
jgi:hypothetical protein